MDNNVYTLRFVRSISCAHQLSLPYPSKCNQPHGHNYNIEVVVAASDLDFNGMVVDVNTLKEIIDGYDHRDLNQIFEGISATTAECFAARLFKQLHYASQNFNKYAKVMSVSISETDSMEVTVSELLP